MGNKNKLPDMLNKEQLVRLFENMHIPKLSIGSFVALMCGLRVNEICTLETCNIDLQQRKLKIVDSKNPNRKKQGYGKDRYVPIPKIALSPIKKWLSIIEGSKWFLPSENSPDKPLSKKTMEEWFALARRKANLDIPKYKVKYKKKINNKEGFTVYKYRFHHLRHFYAQYLYERTRDLYAVSNLLGHNQISTTQIYAKVSDKQKQESVEFAFNTPIQTKIFEQNPVSALNYSIPEIAKRDKKPIEILEERFAKGEISAVDFQTALRLIKLKQEHFNENETKETNNTRKVEID